MAHVRCRYSWDDDDTVRVSVSVGPNVDHLRHVGELVCHPSEFNAIDRLLTAGMFNEKPANTYDLKRPTYYEAIDEIAEDVLVGRLERPRLVSSGRRR